MLVLLVSVGCVVVLGGAAWWSQRSPRRHWPTDGGSSGSFPFWVGDGSSGDSGSGDGGSSGDGAGGCGGGCGGGS